MGSLTDDKPPVPRYRFTLTVTGNTLDEIESELVSQTRGGWIDVPGESVTPDGGRLARFLLDSDYYKRDEWEVWGGVSTSRMEHLNPTMTPDRYAQELDTWFQRRKSAHRDGETR